MRSLFLVEDTQFKISKDATTYALVLPHFHTMYESEFLKLPISAFGSINGLSRSSLVGLPLAMEVPGVAWMAITEADMRGNAAMYLTDPEMGWSGKAFLSRISPGEDPEVVVAGALPHHSAWRVLMVGDEPGRLIESNILTSLNPESEVKDTTWIHAGLTAWDWWSGDIDKNGKPAFTTDNMKYYVDFAAHSGFPYMLIDAGWSVPGDITRMNGKVDIPEVVRYAAARNVKVWIWLTYTETDRQMEEAFPLYAKWGLPTLLQVNLYCMIAVRCFSLRTCWIYCVVGEEQDLDSSKRTVTLTTDLLIDSSWKLEYWYGHIDRVNESDVVGNCQLLAMVPLRNPGDALIG